MCFLDLITSVFVNFVDPIAGDCNGWKYNCALHQYMVNLVQTTAIYLEIYEMFKP